MKLIAFFNGFNIKHVDGGSYHVFRVLKNWSNYISISIVIPKLGYETCSHLIEDSYSVYLSSQDNETPSGNIKMVLAYFSRIIRASFMKYGSSPDIIICSSHLLYDVIPAAFLRKRVKAKLVIYVHHIISQFRSGEQGFWSRISQINERLGLFLLHSADLIFAVNEDVRSRLLSKGFDSDKIFVVGNGLDHSLIQSVMAATIKFEACFCGRLVERKGVFDLLHIWQKVIEKFPHSKLVIMGNGPEYGNLQKRIQSDKLEDHVILAGFVTDREKIATLKSSMIFIFPSYEEGWGIGVTEAMACGACVVTYDLPTYNVFGDSLVRIQIGDKERMAQKIIELLENSKERELYVNNAIEQSRGFDWDQISDLEYSQILKLKDK